MNAARQRVIARATRFATLRAMIFPAARSLAAALFLLGASACIPTRDPGADEQREPHFLRGQELRKQLDHRGAAAAFEHALEANPRSASAHFELGLLYEQPLNEPATAVYHFERFLKLRPKSDRADIVRSHVTNCKMELAKLFLIAPNAPSAQKEIDKLKTEVERLGVENNQLRRQVETLAAGRTLTTTGAPPALAVATLPPAARATSNNGLEAGPKSSVPKVPEPPAKTAKTSPPPPAAPMTPRTHTVKSGDIPATIAKQYGVKLEALIAANPGLDPKRMKVGQTVTIPAP